MKNSRCLVRCAIIAQKRRAAALCAALVLCAAGARSAQIVQDMNVEIGDNQGTVINLNGTMSGTQNITIQWHDHYTDCKARIIAGGADSGWVDVKTVPAHGVLSMATPQPVSQITIYVSDWGDGCGHTHIEKIIVDGAAFTPAVSYYEIMRIRKGGATVGIAGLRAADDTSPAPHFRVRRGTQTYNAALLTPQSPAAAQESGVKIRIGGATKVFRKYP